MELKTFFAQDLMGNVIPSPTVTVYQPDTVLLATGLRDASGQALSNPFTGTTSGRVVLAAPDGDYDIKIEGAGLVTKMRVRFIDSVAGSAEILRVQLAAADGADRVGYGAETVQDALDARLPEIANYAALRAYNGQVTAYYVRGVANIFDGGAGVFRVDASDTTTADNGGTVLVDASGRRWKREFSGAVNVRWFGARGDGVTDDNPPIQSAINAAESVYFPAAPVYYLVQSPLQQTRRNYLRGDGKSSIVRSNSSDIFWIGVASGVSDQSTIENLALVSAGGGGHIFVQKNQVIGYRFTNLYCQQENDSKSIYSHTEDLGNYIGNVWRHGEFYHKNTASVPAFNFIVSSASGAANFNKWSEMEIVRGSKPWFYFESARSGNYIYDITLEDILAEVTIQGIARGLGVNGFVANRVKVFDLTTGGASVSANMFDFGRGTNATNQPSRNIKISEYKRTDADSALNGFVDFAFSSASGASAQNVEFYGCSRNVASSIIADLTNCYDTTIYSSRISVIGSGFVNLSQVGSLGVDADFYLLKNTRLSAHELEMAATVSNFALPSSASMLICTPTGSSRTLTGIVAPASPSQSAPRFLTIFNASSSNNIVVGHDITSASANRFLCPLSTNYEIPPLSGCVAFYSASAQRWCIIDK